VLPQHSPAAGFVASAGACVIVVRNIVVVVIGVSLIRVAVAVEIAEAGLFCRIAHRWIGAPAALSTAGFVATARTGVVVVRNAVVVIVIIHRVVLAVAVEIAEARLTAGIAKGGIARPATRATTRFVASGNTTQRHGSGSCRIWPQRNSQRSQVVLSRRRAIVQPAGGGELHGSTLTVEFRDDPALYC